MRPDPVHQSIREGSPAAATLVSVMMPAFNAERFIGPAIESVLAQTYPAWELVVVDDGSIDETAAVASRFDDRRIRILRQENQGEAAARNRCLAEMRGEWVAFLDADDEFLPDHLQATLEFLAAHSELAAVYADGFYIDEHGRRLGSLSSRRRGPFEGWIFEQFVRASDVLGPPICAVLSRRLVNDHALSFDPRIVIGPDWDFTTRFAEFGRFGYLDRPTCLYRVHHSNVTLVTASAQRHQSLAQCRENAIRRPAFQQCSSETRAYAFYDLLVNHLADQPRRQQQVTGWPQFAALPAEEQARLYRLMASQAILHRTASDVIHQWLEASRRLDPSDLRSRVLSLLHAASPRICYAVIRLRNWIRGRREATTPFGVLD